MKPIIRIVSLIAVTFIVAIGAYALINGVGKREGLPKEFIGSLAYQHVVAQCELGPRPVGTATNRATAEYIMQQLTKAGWSAELQTFTHLGVEVRNVVAKSKAGDAPIILGAHYDTRPVADQDSAHPDKPVPGANDGASGVAVLLELSRSLDLDKVESPIWLAFFDAEDSGKLGGWDWSVGATYMAAALSVTPQAVIVVDMVGDADQQLYMEGNSDPELSHQIWNLANSLGFNTFIPQIKWSMIDDHLPFRERGIPVVLIIDFDYPYWHTIHDTSDKVSAESLERVGRVLEHWLESGE